SGLLENVVMLVSQGANINIKDKNNLSPIIKALKYDDVFDYLLKQKADLNTVDNCGIGLVHILWNDIDKLNKLKNYNAKMDLKDYGGKTILHYSAEDADTNLIKEHLSMGININSVDYQNKSPIFYSKNIQIFEFLHQNGANLNIQDIYGNSLLHQAIIKKQNNIIDYLIDNEINLDLEDINGKTPLFLTIDNPELFDKLNQAGADLHHKDKNGQNLLHYAAINDNSELYLKLLNLGLNPFLKNNSGKTSVDIAKSKNNIAIINMFKTGDIGFAKVVGMTQLKKELSEAVIEPLTNKKLYEKYKIPASNGILLYGLPGCGKTFIAEALAEESGRNFFQLKTSDFSSTYLGIGTEAIKNVFEKAKANAPSIVFIDEMDGLPRRTEGNDPVSADNNQIVNELLQQMNHLQENNVFVIGATNNPEMIDTAIKRPGRLDRRFFVPPPDEQARVWMFRKELQERPCNSDIDYTKLATKTEYYIAKEISLIVQNAAKTAMKDNCRKIEMKDLTDAIKQIKPSIAKQDVEKYKKKLSISDTANIDNNRSIINSKDKGFAKIAGMSDLKKILYEDVIEPLKDVKLYKKYGLEPANGLLLYGPPGTGKTFISSALAEECNRYFVSIKPSDVLSPYYGETTLNIRKFFETAEYNAPSIVFIDEIDALAPSRRNGHSVSVNQVTELLQQLNDCADKNIFVIAATNEPQNIDEAVKRVGRFDKMIFVPPPDLEARKELFKMKLKNIYAEQNLDYDRLAELTENYTAKEIQKCIIEEAAKAAKRQKRRISYNDLLKQINNYQPQLCSSKIEEYREKGNL
ncbi:MAG: AAA family ATPase, partial [bacterium]|nr:AAA family ATPase [bacterium]